MFGKVLHGDCIDVLKTLEDNSVDSVITDPPYGLSKAPDIAEVMKHWIAGTKYDHASNGFMGKSWDSFVPNPDIWKEVYRVLKPGGFALVFAGSRTQDLMGISLRFAGFEIRDCLQWLYGSGFPKSYNISKGVDKAAGVGREVVGTRQHPTLKDTSKIDRHGSQQFHGDNTISDEWNITAPATEEAKQWDGWGTALKPAYEPIIVAMKPIEKTYANNALTHGVSGLNIDGCRVGVGEKVPGGGKSKRGEHGGVVYGDGEAPQNAKPHTNGRFPANVIHDGSDEVIAGFPYTTSGGGVKNPVGSNVYGGNALLPSKTKGDGAYCPPSKGSASRFFYCAKATKSERNAAIENKHPTVKPLKLMEYLCTLTKTPTGGVVLDPFAGSGTTGVACVRTDRSFILIERDEESYKIADKRITHEISEKKSKLEI